MEKFLDSADKSQQTWLQILLTPLGESYFMLGSMLVYFLVGLHLILFVVILVGVVEPFDFVLRASKRSRESFYGKVTQHIARSILYRLAKLFRLVVSRMGLIQVRISGQEQLNNNQSPVIIAANHPSLIDVMWLLSLVPNLTCIVKNDLKQNWIWCSLIRCLGYVSNREPEHVVDLCVAKFLEGESVLFFPEGTRTPPGEVLGPLSRGLAAVALRASVRPLVVTMKYSRPLLAKGSSRLILPRRHIDLEIGICYLCQLPETVRENSSGDRLKVGQEESVLNAVEQRQAARLLTHQLEIFFHKQLSHEHNRFVRTRFVRT